MTPARSRPGRPALAIVPRSAPVEAAPSVSFCSHCGERPEGVASSRVCEVCGFGVLLQSSADVAPAPGQAFLVLDDAMAVCGMSAAAESLLATRETEAVHRHVTELLVAADAEAGSPHNLAVAITWAARGEPVAQRVVVRPANTFGVRLPARIAACGPPRAALLVFERPLR